MPYLRITCPDVADDRRRAIATRLTEYIGDSFSDSHSPTTRAELRERTTVHFVPYGPDELFVGGRRPAERDGTDVTIELSDWNMSVRRQREVARTLTPLVAELFDVPPDAIEEINIRFHSYRPSDFAVGGTLLSDTIPLVDRVVKLLSG